MDAEIALGLLGPNERRQLNASNKLCPSWTGDGGQEIPVVVVTPQDTMLKNAGSSGLGSTSVHIVVCDDDNDDDNDNNQHHVDHNDTKASNRNKRKKKKKVMMVEGEGDDDDEEATKRRDEEASGDETQDEELQKYLDDKRQSNRKRRKPSRSEGFDEAMQSREEQIVNNIKLQKELIDKIRFQPWRMHKKLKILRKAKAYVKGHESSLSKRQDYQQRGADAWRRIRRELMNAASVFIPWEMRIKRVESHFGSVVASYFLFLRWMLWVNSILTLLTVSFIIVPQMIGGEKQVIPEDQVAKSEDLDKLLAAEGILKYSVFFYGNYQSELIGSGYKMPMAYLITGLTIYVLSIIIVLRKMAANARLNKMASKDELFSFSWKMFSSWDYMLGNAETANNKYAAIITAFKESIREVEEKQKVEKKKLLIFLRTLGVIFSILLYGASGFLTYYVVTRSEDNPEVEKSYFEANATTWVITVIFLVFPNFFDLISKMEQYHPRTNLRAQLARVFILNFLNVASLLYSLHQKILNESSCIPNSLSIAGTPTPPNTQEIISGQNGRWSETKDKASGGLTSSKIPWLTASNNYSQPTFSSQSSSENCTKTQSLKCWENYVGQEVFKLTELDLAMTIILILLQDFLLGIWVRFCNKCWCWNLEKTYPEYPEFKTAENILHLVNNQGMIWLGWFFSPGLSVMNLIKLVILAYVRFWTVLVCNVPEKRIFRASRSNNFYYVLLLLMLFICCVPPMIFFFDKHSRDCGPFRNRADVMEVFDQHSPVFAFIMKYAKKPATSFILLGVLSMIIYYLWSISRSLKENNTELKKTLEYERTEGKKKVYAMADDRDEINKKDDVVNKAKRAEAVAATPEEGIATVKMEKRRQTRNTASCSHTSKAKSEDGSVTRKKENPKQKPSAASCSHTSKAKSEDGSVTRKKENPKQKPSAVIGFHTSKAKSKNEPVIRKMENPKQKSSAAMTTQRTANKRSSEKMMNTAQVIRTKEKKTAPFKKPSPLNPAPASSSTAPTKPQKKPSGGSSKYPLMHTVDREVQRLKYETRLEEIKLAKLKKFQLNREIKQVENRILEWAANSCDDMSTEPDLQPDPEAAFRSMTYRSPQQRRRHEECQKNIRSRSRRERSKTNTNMSVSQLATDNDYDNDGDYDDIFSRNGQERNSHHWSDDGGNDGRGGGGRGGDRLMDDFDVYPTPTRPSLRQQKTVQSRYKDINQPESSLFRLKDDRKYSFGMKEYPVDIHPIPSDMEYTVFHDNLAYKRNQEDEEEEQQPDVSPS